MRITTYPDGTRWLDLSSEHEAKVWWALAGFWVPPIDYDLAGSGRRYLTQVRREHLNHAFNRRAE